MPRIKITTPDGKVLSKEAALPKKRNQVLFSPDTPFKPKRVPSKKAFKRREKYQRKQND